jgi:hypothetical protein
LCLNVLFGLGRSVEGRSKEKNQKVSHVSNQREK